MDNFAELKKLITSALGSNHDTAHCPKRDVSVEVIGGVIYYFHEGAEVTASQAIIAMDDIPF